MSAWTMMEQSSPGCTIGERRFIRNKRSDKWRNEYFMRFGGWATI
ncbi:hypothetical protein [Paenibacillus polymyxa]